ncbi:hypothetical protein N7G274_009052 [Stereocaulon virgatum]|uniref:Fucose-specific lectin n=1 Tax=Stereocaulon virgatum TaxID=373712 RepID=A0ABR3ZWX6_9LECA
MAGARPWSKALPPAPETMQHNTLEVDSNRWLEQDGTAAPIVAQYPQNEKVVGYNDEKILSYGNGKIVDHNDVSKQVVAFEAYDLQSELSPPEEEHKFMGLRRKTFFILLLVVLVLVIAGIVGGGAGGAMAARNKGKPAPVPTNTSVPTPQARYAKTGLAAIQWTDSNGTLHKRLYYQDNSDKIRESAWDNSTAFDSAWRIHVISDAVKPGTPIAAAAGYPHASRNHSLVKNVYYMSTNDELFERQAPSNNSQAWENDNFSGLYSGSNSTFLTAYWNQNFLNVSQELVVLFQEQSFANGITQSRYTSNSTTSNPWVANNFGFSQPQGSTFAMSLVSYRSGKHLMLYTVDDGKHLQQHEYTISDTDLVSTAIVSLTSSSSTGLTVEPQSPLAVVAQDNQPLYTTDTLPECTKNTPLTNLILFAVSDRTSLVLSAWNCSTGFLDQTSEIKPLQKVDTTFLSLAAMSDRATGNGSVYIMFDSGSGPQVEEWAVPKRAGDPWVTTRNVTVDFGL